MKNIEKKVDFFEFNIDPEWFSYHVMMSQTYDPSYSTIENVDLILDILDEKYTETIKEYPLALKKEIKDTTLYLASYSIIDELMSSPDYKKLQHKMC